MDEPMKKAILTDTKVEGKEELVGVCYEMRIGALPEITDVRLRGHSVKHLMTPLQMIALRRAVTDELGRHSFADHVTDIAKAMGVPRSLSGNRFPGIS